MPSTTDRILILIYGIVSYVIGVAGLSCIIVAMANWIPFGFLHPRQTAFPILSNVILVGLWGLIHSVMARPRFKSWITKTIAQSAERSTYVLVSGVTSILLIGLWRNVPGLVWSVTNATGVKVIWSLFGFGWAYLLASSFAINHFDLFGLRQAYMYFIDRPLPPLKFVKTAMYRFTRHPIQTGVLIGVWVTPVMTVTHVILSIGFTVYLFIGLWFEDRDLVRAIGEPYVQYQREAGKVFPKFFGRS